MAEIYFSCPSCKAALALDESFAGQSVDCPSCEQSAVVPTAKIRWNCPTCDTAMAAPEGATGEKVACAECGAESEAPKPSMRKLSLHKEKKTCPDCEAEAEADQVICLQCGYNFETKTSAPKAEEEPEGLPPEKKRLYILAGAGGGALLLALVLWLILGRGSHTPPTPLPAPKPAVAKPKPEPEKKEPAPTSEEIEKEREAERAAKKAAEEEAARLKAEEEAAAHQAEQASRAALAEELFSRIYPVPPIIVSRSLRVQGTDVEYVGDDIERMTERHKQKDWLALINHVTGGEYEEYPEPSVIEIAARKMKQRPFDIRVRSSYKPYDPKTKKFMGKPGIVVAAFELDSVRTPTFHTIGAAKRTKQHRWTIEPNGYTQTWRLDDADGLVLLMGTPDASKMTRELEQKYEPLLTRAASGPAGERRERIEAVVREYYKEFAKRAQNM